MKKSTALHRITAEMAVTAGTFFISALLPMKGGKMASFDNNTMRGFRKEGKYTSSELSSSTLDDGTKVVTAPITNIKRRICGGIDVHKSVLMACACVTDKETLSAVFYVRQFTSSNSEIRRMAEWFAEYGVKDVCMESTGKYWIPVYDILEQNGMKPVLTHPKYVKQAKGRKTDFRDAIHIANLFRMDLVVASFIPPADIRDLRELCRYRLKLTYIRTSEKNRFQNSMTISKIRLDSVFTDPFGKSASRIMEYLINTPEDKVQDEKILSLVDRRVKASSEEILDSIHGYEFIGVQRDKLEIISKHIDDVNKCIDLIDKKLDYYRFKYASIINHLCTIPGVSTESALYILGEIGADMSVWNDSKSLASWAGLSPANNESAGKKKSTKIGKGGHYLKPLLVQCALASIKSTKKQPYFFRKYQTLKKRRGHKKAVIAIARKMLVSIYHMIKEDKDFLPIDYEQVMEQKQNDRELNLKNVILFLGERGVDDKVIRMIESQCSKEELSEGKAAETKPKKTAKEKQPESNTTAKPVKKRGSRKSSTRTKKETPSVQSSAATA